MATYSCRACRRPLQAAKGCVLCDPVRPHLVITEDDDVSLAMVSKETVKGLREQLRQYTGLLRAAIQPKQRELYNSNIRAVANTLAKVIDSARKIQEEGAKAIELMSTSEQVDLLKEFYAELPVSPRLRLLADLQELETTLNSTDTAGWKDLAHDVETRGN